MKLFYGNRSSPMPRWGGYSRSYPLFAPLLTKPHAHLSPPKKYFLAQFALLGVCKWQDETIARLSKELEGVKKDLLFKDCHLSALESYVRSRSHPAAFYSIWCARSVGCGWEGNRGPGGQYWHLPPGMHLYSWLTSLAGCLPKTGSPASASDPYRPLESFTFLLPLNISQCGFFALIQCDFWPSPWVCITAGGIQR